MRVVIVSLAVLLVSQPALAQWKWRDARGNVTVSDLPPPREVLDKDILQRPAAAALPAAPPASVPASAAAADTPQTKPSAPIDPELQARKKAADEAQVAKANAEAEKLRKMRRENCRIARESAAAMSSGQRVIRMNEKGEPMIMDDRQRAEEARRARSVMASDCS